MDELGRLLRRDEEGCRDVWDIFSTGDAVWIAETIVGSDFGEIAATPSFLPSSLEEASLLLESAAKENNSNNNN